MLNSSARIAVPLLFGVALVMGGCSGGRPNVTEFSDAEAGAGNQTNSGGTSTSSTTQNSSSGGSGGGAVVFTLGGTSPVATGGTSAATSSKPPECGNGMQEPGEACDDGNKDNGDGCPADCLNVEEGYVCPVQGTPCVPLQVCGDKKIAGTENCDDGNTTAGDGCSEVCRTESGWACPFVATRCIADKCGDGILVGAETCDDGEAAPKSGDGCSEDCTIESPGPTERDAWICLTPGEPCARTTCGNGKVEGTEQCDDGNNDTGDGCSPACRMEPACPPEGGACKSVCGDGMILPDDTDQKCDDGNSTNGDGCSSSCQIEDGYKCENAPLVAKGQLLLPVVYRDFKGGTKVADGQHPDFEHAGGNDLGEKGIVQDKLGLDGKPMHSATAKSTTTNNDTATTPDWFSIWYRDATGELPTAGSPRYNYTFIDTLKLTETGTDSGTFRYSNTSFYPLDGRTPSWGNTATYSHNYHFTSEVRYWFQYNGNELLTFSGDDDVWVFVNKQLAVDLGGIHNAIDGSVLLDAETGSGSICEKAAPGCATPRVVNFGLEKGKVYEIVVFQAERHTTKSNYTLTLSAFTSTRSTCKPVCGDGIVTPDEACDLGTEKNTGEYNTCTPQCTLPPYCGDGNVDLDPGKGAHEDCDDGVNLAVYGYNSTRACAAGCKWTHVCGDGNLDALFGEECDDGNHVAGDGCEANCTHRAGCGDSVVDRSKGEECDDGNTVSGDGCSEFCTKDKLY